MQLGRPKTEVPYWDDGNRNMVEWFKKGAWKKILRKRWIRKQLKGIDKSE